MIHIVSYSTPEVGRLFGCWHSWTAQSIEADAGHQYAVHSHMLPSGVGGGHGQFGDGIWQAAVRHKVAAVLQLLQARHGPSYYVREEDGVLIFSDVDVLPLRPYSVLASHLGSTTDIIFASTPSSLCRGAYRDVGNSACVNTGVYALRNSLATRRLFEAWVEVMGSENKTGRPFGDQSFIDDAIAAAASTSRGARPLRWARFNDSVVTNALPSITSRTVAYHAFGGSVHRPSDVNPHLVDYDRLVPNHRDQKLLQLARAAKAAARDDMDCVEPALLDRMAQRAQACKSGGRHLEPWCAVGGKARR